MLATDSKGAPITDLTQKDFTVIDEGKEEPVAFFDIADSRVQILRQTAKTPVTFTNRIPVAPAASAPVMYVILFDGLNTQVTDQAYARQQIVQFLNSIHSGDMVAVYVLGNGLRIAHDFTDDVAALRRTAEALSAVTSRFDSAAQETIPSSVPAYAEFASQSEKRIEAQFIQNRVRTTLSAIEAIAHHLEGVPGRKNLLWVSGSFPLAIGPQHPDESYSRLDLLRSYGDDLAKAMRAVNQANVAIYPIDPRGLIAPLDERARSIVAASDASAPSPIARRTAGDAAGKGGKGSGGGSSGGGSSGAMLADSAPPIPKIPNPFEIRESDNTRSTMREIAELTGGRAYYNTNDIADSLREAMNDSRFTYVLGFYPTHEKWNGRFHEIKVHTSRSGIHLRFRHGYFAAPDTPLDADAIRTVLKEASAAPLNAGAVELTAAFEKGASSTDLARMRLRVNLNDLSITTKEKGSFGALDLLVEMADSSGSAVWKDGQHVNLSLLPATFTRVRKEGLKFNILLPRMDGAVEVRVAVRDANTGTFGTLRVPVAAIRQIFP
ncbi:MAG: VWA domain-containing protein [Acidobacteria bacterium]|nr:VWA domain-containing protein [Acidobacteriota bacterium]